MSDADKYRKRAETVAKQLKRRTYRHSAPLIRKKKALEALAENEDWLDGKISPELSKPTREHISETILRFIAEHPGLTEAEICRALKNGGALPNNKLLPLIKKGLLDRQGQGGRADPYRYFARGRGRR